MDRIKSIWITIVSCFLIINNSFCQQFSLSDTVTVHFEKGPLTNALQQLSDKTGIRFAYRNNLVKSRTVREEKAALPLAQILDRILLKNQLCYTYQKNQVIIHTNCFPTHYTVSGNVYEDSTFQPIPYVAVSLAGKPAGTIADRDGLFEINIPWTDDGYDTIIFSSMGYIRDTIIFDPGNRSILRIGMKQKIYPVEPIVISPKEFEKIVLGNIKDHQNGSLYLDTHGQQTALFLKNKKNKTGILTTVSYYLSKDGNTDAPFRARIYSMDSSGLPGTDLVEDAIVVKPEMGEGWYSINIEKLKIEMPEEGVYIAIEGVFPDDYEDYYGESEFIDLRRQNNRNNSPSLTYGQRLGYNRKCRKETWHYSISKVWFQLEKQSFGVMIAAVVKYEKEHEKGKNKKR